jgi:GTPase involved in cell partitioning and DNA repair
MTKTPIELLDQELRLYEKALKKSQQHFIEGKIDLCLHTKHVKNLEPIISEYKFAVNILTQHQQ